jgi:peptidoglycan hydrolase-like protein with peptidoglycan-binding domain
VNRSPSTFAAIAAMTLALTACHQAVGATRTSAANPVTTQQQTLAPDLVRDIQRSLNQRGYGVGSVDGVMGDSTVTALERFQRDNSLPSRGQIDEQTLAALGVTGINSGSVAQAPAVPQTRRSLGAAPQSVSPRMAQDIQRELQRLGYDPGRPDGVWGRRSRRALSEFQRDRNLAPTGRIDGQTLAALEAGGTPQTSQLPERIR